MSPIENPEEINIRYTAPDHEEEMKNYDIVKEIVSKNNSNEVEKQNKEQVKFREEIEKNGELDEEKKRRTEKDCKIFLVKTQMKRKISQRNHLKMKEVLLLMSLLI